MKRKAYAIILTLALCASLVGCGTSVDTDAKVVNTNEENASEVLEVESSEEVVESTEGTQEPHTHSYNETITNEATCTEEGEKSFACECGDSYIEPIEAKGHDFGEYMSNGDATYTTDGTETGTCACGLTDTRIAEGSKLEYTYTDMEATKYAKSSVNVRDLPSSDGNKLGGLSSGQEVKVVGTCNETEWYKIEYNGDIAYVSNSYLVDTKPEPPKAETPKEETPAPTPEPTPAPVVENPAPAPEPTPEPTPAPVQEEWVQIKDDWSMNSDTHKHTVGYREIYSLAYKEDVTEEAHTWVAGEVGLHHDINGNEEYYATYHCSVCGFEAGMAVQ